MPYYPIFLELKGSPCLVIGGGEVAYQKAKALVKCGAEVRVVSPELGAGLKRLAQQGRIRWRRGRFTARDLAGVQLVVAATDDQPVNELAAAEARRRGLWVNVVDQPSLCSFIVSSVVRRGRLCLAISTGGASPALSKWIRKDLQARYGPEFRRLVGAMARIRGRVIQKVPGGARRKRLFERALKTTLDVLRVPPSTSSREMGSDS